MINPKSLENLRPFNAMSKEEHAEISRRAGKASGESRRKEKQENEIIAALTKYGTAFKVFLDLCEMPTADFNRAVKKAMEQNHRSQKPTENEP